MPYLRVAIALYVASVVATPALGADPSVPRALEEWRGWVLAGEEYRQCPWFAAPAGSPGGATTWQCIWPGRLSLAIGARGGEFRQAWQVEREAWVVLPGSSDLWPQEVTIDGRPGAIVVRGGVPQARLAPGTHQLAGRFEWRTRPESLAIPSETGLIDLTIDGSRVESPTRTGGALFLGARQGAAEAASFDVEVHRLVVDDLPARLVTRLSLRATGGSREVVLGPVLPAGFVPIALDSPLPARVEPDGRLRLQLRAGTYTVELAARATSDLSAIARPTAAAPWPTEEIWSFSGVDRLRVAALEGGEGIDPAQANVPQAWRTFPAFRVLAATALSVVERSRGMAGADGNPLSLARALWLDFDREAFTAVDQVSGTMRADWRLDMAAPWTLASAKQGDQALLVTRGGDDTLTGIELRAPEVALRTVARSASASGALPATGWSTRFEKVSGQLNLPPGHRLVAALGVDAAPGAWLEQWGLWSLFGVVIVAVFAGWLGGPVCGALAFVALLLTYQDSPKVIWLWANLLAALALARAAPEGRLRRFATAYRTVSFALLALVLVPFMWQQLRLAIHPQLDALAARAAVVESVAASAAPSADMAMPKVSGEVALSRAPESPVPAPPAPGPERFAPGTIVQTGPGIPSWRFVSYTYSWSGPVEPTQTARFVIAGPVAMSAWRVVGVLLLAALFAWLLAIADGRLHRYVPPRLRSTLARSVAPWLAMATLALVVAPSPAAAQWPDATLLNELKTRLTRPAECEPDCAEMLAARAIVDSSRLTLEIDAAALARLAVPVPAAPGAWWVDTVTVDGEPSVALRRGADEALWIPLAPGAHRIVVAGRLARSDSLQLVFPWVPRRASVTAMGWDVAGVVDGRMPGRTLDFSRQATRRAGGAGEEAGATAAATPEFPPFVRVVRHFVIGTDSRVRTQVERIAPVRAAFSVPVPLVAGESVLAESVDVRDGREVRVAFAAGEPAVGWDAALPSTGTLALTAAAADAPFVEVWEFSVSPQWHASFDGFAATLPDSIGPEWVYEFHPRPGESLQAQFARPPVAPGESLAIDRVEHDIRIGKRATDSTLSVRYRATQGGRHAVMLPPDARVTAVSVDGESLALRPEKGRLSLPILPGEHTVLIDSTQARGIGSRARPDPLDLGVAASNVTTSLALPADRWALLAIGPGVGPAILYWGEIVAFLLTAWAVGRSGRSPLRTREWVLLGLGLSTLSWAVLALVALWLFAIRWREGWSGAVPRLTFNLVQVLLALLTLVAVGALLFSGIRRGLLSTPDMGVVGPLMGEGRFAWFVDRTGGALPRPSVFSLPLWVFKLLVFAWAVWAAFAVLRWLRTSWHAWRSGGYWR
ncbi:MAG: hypothetical protein AB7G76_02205 [Steroidobacteraceae bacterium]